MLLSILAVGWALNIVSILWCCAVSEYDDPGSVFIFCLLFSLIPYMLFIMIIADIIYCIYLRGRKK